jgi:hypothetical protein
MALRLKAMGQPNYAGGFELALHETALQLPLKWKKPQTIFVNSMSNLFLHKDVPVEVILKTFDVMRRANWHVFQILTKRSDRLLGLSSELPWRPHIWMGVSGEPIKGHAFHAATKDFGKRRLVGAATLRGLLLGEFALLDSLDNSGDEHALRSQLRCLGGRKADIFKHVSAALVERLGHFQSCLSSARADCNRTWLDSAAGLESPIPDFDFFMKA